MQLEPNIDLHLLTLSVQRLRRQSLKPESAPLVEWMSMGSAPQGHTSALLKGPRESSIIWVLGHMVGDDDDEMQVCEMLLDS